jgi:MFS family permease
MMVLPFLALYLHRTLGYSVQDAGIALTAYGVGAFVTAPFAGRVSDFVGARRVMIASLFLSGVMLFVLLLAKSFVMILVVIVIWAIISEAFRPASLANIADLVTPEQRKTAFSVNRLAINLGMSIGPALGGFLILFSYPLLFVVDGATSLLAGVVLLLAPWRPVNHEHRMHIENGGVQSDVPPHAGPARIWKDRRLLYFLVGIIPVVVVFFQHNGAMPLYLVNNLHLSESTYGLLFTVNTALIILLEVPLNIAMSHWSHRKALALGSFLSGLGFGAMGLVSDTLGVALTVVVWSFGEMILLPGASNYMADIAPSHRRGTYMGLFQMTFSFSFAISGWVGTSTLEHFGGQVLWGATFVAGCISALFMWRVK